MNPHHNSITVFIDSKDANKAYELYHDHVIENEDLSSISRDKDTAMFSITTPEINEITLTHLLVENDIEPVLINYTKTEILLFVEWEFKYEVSKLLNTYKN